GSPFSYSKFSNSTLTHERSEQTTAVAKSRIKNRQSRFMNPPRSEQKTAAANQKSSIENPESQIQRSPSTPARRAKPPLKD
ncbi:MAG: hypothetical protein WA952_11375, partial [Lewinella sp.]